MLCPAVACSVASSVSEMSSSLNERSPDFIRNFPHCFLLFHDLGVGGGGG